MGSALIQPPFAWRKKSSPGGTEESSHSGYRPSALARVSTPTRLSTPAGLCAAPTGVGVSASRVPATAKAAAPIAAARAIPRSVPALGGVHIAHRQTHAPLAIHLENLDPNHIAFLQLVADALDALFGDLRDVHQAVAARKNGHEGAEVHQACDLALIHPAHLDVRGDQFDASLGFAAGGTLH